MLEFWHMGGHGFYIWGSWGVALLLFVLECLFLLQNRRHRLQRLKRIHSQQENG